MRNVEFAEPDYFYLTSQLALTGRMNHKALREDIQRGVKRLTDYSYCKGYGATNTSLFFLNQLRDILGAQNLKGKYAVLELDKNNNPILRVQTTTGFELVFTGLAGGYYGEGSRGCRDILKAVGFSKAQYEKPFKEETFKVIKRKQ